MTLREFVLTYERDGKIVANLFDYYDMKIKYLDKRFENYSYYSSKLVLCYFKDHADINPSMGWRYTSQLKGVRICHCFGCHKSADVVRLHQILRKQYDGVDLTEKDACYELAEIFDIPLNDFSELDDDDFDGKYDRRRRRSMELSKRYTQRDFSAELLNQRRNGVDLEAVNDECVKMIATMKQLYI